MRIKCVSSRIGTIAIPGHGSRNFGANSYHIVSDEVGSYLIKLNPGAFKFVSNEQPKTEKVKEQKTPEREENKAGSYTEAMKSIVRFKTTAVEDDAVERKHLEDED